MLTVTSATLRSKDIGEYPWLRAFVTDGISGDRATFERRFSTYYGLNSAGLTKEFKSAYFQLLFEYRTPVDGDAHTPVLRRLYEFPRHRGDQIVAASFASKLVAIHDESQPLFDRHVQAFFGLGVPTIGPLDLRIDGFVMNLRQIRSTYETWSQSPELNPVIERVRLRHVGLAGAHAHRIMDFLVWATGRRLGVRQKQMCN